MPAETGNFITTLIMIVNFSIPLAKTGIFSQCIAVKRPKNYLPYLLETPSHNTIILIWILPRNFNWSLFWSSTHVIPHPLMPYVTRPGGRRPPVKRQTLIRLQELGDRRWLAGVCIPGNVHWGRAHYTGGSTLVIPVWFHPGGVHLSPILHPIAQGHTREGGGGHGGHAFWAGNSNKIL